MLATPMLGTVQACGGGRKPKNCNVQSFSVTAVASIAPILSAEWKYIPSEENPKMIVVSWEGIMLSYTLTVGENMYYLDTDFEYTEHCVRIAVGAPFTNAYGLPSGSESNYMKIDFMYDFSSVPGGIDGTLKMRTVSYNGETFIRSLGGTGDLRHVRIMATSVSLGHDEGVVIGWPE
jgi:hypothetical protein